MPPARAGPCTPGRVATWAPVLVGVAAAGLVVAGLVPTDPALGYPPGRPEGLTDAGRIHQVAGLAMFGSLSAAAFVVARRMREAGRGWARYLRTSGVLIIVFAFAAGIADRLDTLDIWRPAPGGLLEHLSLLAGFCWIAAVALWLLRRRADRGALLPG